ncbi:hypothetical protein [Serratia liquefaciens]|uniref:hypothetical protein n=1 Tax=Serratia liquefaciens TaxID=614 RepID=UPI00061B6D77|nr:hypothetical protein [Serratia liquefaciens]AKE09170.1 hypothetical protein XJ20_04405 [Serratia liquefaciens]
MDNKLSELSKPVMYVVRTLDGSVASVKNYKYTAPKGFTSAPLYSQEYLSALLAELEKAQRANNCAPAILRQLAEEKQKRGEVAAATAFNYAASALQKELSK